MENTVDTKYELHIRYGIPHTTKLITAMRLNDITINITEIFLTIWSVIRTYVP